MNHEPLGRRAVLDTSKEIVSLNVTARMPYHPFPSRSRVHKSWEPVVGGVHNGG